MPHRMVALIAGVVFVVSAGTPAARAGTGARTLYVTSADAGAVTALSIGSGGTLSEPGGPVAAGSGARAVAVTPDGRFVYVANYAAENISAYAVPASGALTPLGGQPFPAGGSPLGMAVAPGGRVLYATDQTNNQVSAFAIGTDGRLTAFGSVSSRDGRHLYVASVSGAGNPDGANVVTAFQVRDDGGLEQIGQPVMEGDIPTTPAVAPDGRFLFVPNVGSSDVSSFAIDAATGGLRQVPGSPFALGPGFTSPSYQAVAVAPDQGPAARFTARAAGQTASFDATSSSDPDGQVARFDWDLGDGTVLPDGGARPAHGYGRPGTYTVRLTVTDDEGCSDHQVFTGVFVLCNGGAAARFSLPVTVGG